MEDKWRNPCNQAFTGTHVGKRKGMSGFDFAQLVGWLGNESRGERRGGLLWRVTSYLGRQFSSIENVKTIIYYYPHPPPLHRTYSLPLTQKPKSPPTSPKIPTQNTRRNPPTKTPISHPPSPLPPQKKPPP